MNRIYLDYNASHPRQHFLSDFESRCSLLNPSSAHAEGRKSRDHIEEVREKIAHFLGVSHTSILFTSGGTEANDLALMEYFLQGQLKKGPVLYTGMEHSSTLGALDLLARLGQSVCKIPYTALWDEQKLQGFLSQASLMVCMAVNSETGIRFPLDSVSRLSRENGVLVHSDSVQALGKEDVDLNGISTASFSGHKIEALAGVGFLYHSPALKWAQLFKRGSQERGLRPGTENMIGILSLAPAFDALKLKIQARAEIQALRERLEQGLSDLWPEGFVIGLDRPRVSNTLNFCFRGLDGQALLMNLDLSGIAASQGSACTSGSIEPSHVLLAMGYSTEEAKSCLRFSLGVYNTQAEIEQVLISMQSILGRMKRK